jgi:rhodanese-related sulfurtransferase
MTPGEVNPESSDGPGIRPWRRRLFFAAFLLLGLCACDRLWDPLPAVKTLKADELRQRLSTGADPLIIDIRSPGAFEAGHIPGAVSLQPRDLSDYLKSNRIPSDRTVVMVCDHGVRSRWAADSVSSLGFREVRSLEGGMSRWTALGYLVDTGPPGTPHR